MADTRTLRQSAALLLCTVSLAACSGGSDTPSSSASAPPPPGEFVVVNHGLDVPQDESTVLAPSELKPDEKLAVAVPSATTGNAPQPLVADAAPAAPAAEADRIAQLEKEVAALRADYNSMMPAFNGLITTNERIQALLDQLEQKAGVAPSAAQPAEAKAAPAPANAAAPAAATPAPEAKAPVTPANPPPADGAAVISGLRLGEHGDKTRLVFDASATTEYQTDINNAEKTLVVTLPAAGWTGKPAVDGLKSPMVAGWTAQATPDGKGTVVAVRLKKDAKIVGHERLKAEGKSTPRIVVDVAADKPAS